MIATLVHVWVKEKNIEDFKNASIINHKASIREQGNLRFDVLQDTEDPSKFILYEAYETEEAAANHKKTAHYLKWRETVADWMLKPREGVKHHILAPESE